MISIRLIGPQVKQTMTSVADVVKKDTKVMQQSVINNLSEYIIKAKRNSLNKRAPINLLVISLPNRKLYVYGSHTTG